MELKSNAHSNIRQTAKETPRPTLMLLLIVQTFSGSESLVCINTHPTHVHDVVHLVCQRRLKVNKRRFLF